MNKFWFRTLGFLGMLGGIILFFGDMLFYYHPESTSLLKNMANASNDRITASGVTSLFATWFYLLGLGQLYYAFKPSPVFIRNLVLVCFAFIFTAYGIVHGAYVAIATTAKVAVQHELNLLESTALASEVNDMLRLFVYPIFAVLSLLFIIQVWKRKTLYPRWIIFFFPLIPFLLQGVVNELVHGKAWVIIMGGYLNLLLVLFFLASTIVLWNKYPES